MDFVAEGLVYGRRLRCLNIVDDYARECLAIEVDTSLPGVRVTQVLPPGGAVSVVSSLDLATADLRLVSVDIGL